MVEITAVFELDCMIAGVLPLSSVMTNLNLPVPSHTRDASTSSTSSVPVPTSLLVLAYTPADTSFFHEATDDRAVQARKVAERPELRIISRAGEELSTDALSVTGFQSWGCNDYTLAEFEEEQEGTGKTKGYLVLSPRDVIVVRPRDRKDHIAWLVERKRYEEALEQIEIMESEGTETIDAAEIGQRYIEHLVGEGKGFVASRFAVP
jgi:vacuolar protein sorting-associated protein 41